MQALDLKYKANYYSILLLSFILPLYKNLIPLAILIFIITSFINNRWRGIKSKKYKKSILLLTPIFFISLISLIYSENKSIGLMNIETKLSLLAFPIAFHFSKLDFKKTIAPVLKSFIEGCLIAVILVLAQGIMHYYYSSNLSDLFYAKLSFFSHSSYFSMYLCFALAIIYYYSFLPSKHFYIKPLINFILIITFTTIIVLLSSKTGWIVMLLIHISSLTYWIFRHKNYLKGGIALLLIATGATLFYFQSPTIKNRVNELFVSTNSNYTNTQNSSTQVRKKVWKITADLILTKPVLGYGCGDSKSALTNEYKKRNLEVLLNKKFNTHNQYLQTTVDTGLIGGIILLITLLFPLILSFRNKYFLYVIFLAIILINFTSESMLETQSGVIFYAFFNTLFFAVLMQQNIDKSVTNANTTN